MTSAGFLVVALAAPVAWSAPGDDWPLYVAVQGQETQLAVISSATETVTGSLQPGPIPYGVAITPDGTTAYVANNPSPGSITPVELPSGPTSAPIPAGSTTYRVAITPDGSTAVATNFFSDTLTVVDVATGTVTATVPVGDFPYGVAITPDGATAWVTLENGGGLVPVSLTTEVAGTPVPLPAGAWDVTITPDGSTAFVAGVDGSLTPVALPGGVAGPAIALGAGLKTVAVDPDGTILYVARYGPADGDDSVVPLSLPDLSVGAPIPLPGEGQSIAFTPDGLTAYVSVYQPPQVVPIDVASGTARAPIPVTGAALGTLAVTPDQAPVAVLAPVVPAPAGSATAFDASGSTVAFGSIASYAWDFGDGSTQTTTVPTTEHVYATPGSYAATVTLTSSGGTSTTQVFTGQTSSRNGGPQAVAGADVSVVAPAPDPVPPAPPDPDPAPAPEPVAPEPAVDAPPGAVPVVQEIASTGSASGTLAATALGLVLLGSVLRALASRRRPNPTDA
ncbi:PKD domain-containing protein [Cellulosimicrobium terreum]|nr:PKD domain-containing protein [Cellulosimicrobium terreum]